MLETLTHRKRKFSHAQRLVCPIDILTKTGYCCLEILRSQEIFEKMQRPCVFFCEYVYLKFGGVYPPVPPVPGCSQDTFRLFNTLISFSFDVRLHMLWRVQDRMKKICLGTWDMSLCKQIVALGAFPSKVLFRSIHFQL